MYCSKCGCAVNDTASFCPVCGAAVQNTKQANFQQQPVINIVNTNTNTNAVAPGNAKNKWVALLLCFFLGALGAHKFYEGKVGMGILYIFTCGLCGIGIIVDFIKLLFKSNPYYV